MSRILRLAVVAAGLLALAGCSSLPPRNALDLCALFAEKKDWQEPALRSETRWGVPVPVLMATMFHESSYRADARPSRRLIFGFIPGPRPSTAYGYAQALDGTWDEYVDSNQRWFARRNDFADAVDFIGWYHQLSVQRAGVTPDDAVNLYLAYHQGRGGFLRNSFLGKIWLIDYAQQVGLTEARYRAQYDGCRPS